MCIHYVGAPRYACPDSFRGPEALDKPIRVPIETVASDMKLQVIEDIPLSDDPAYFGTIRLWMVSMFADIPLKQVPWIRIRRLLFPMPMQTALALCVGLKLPLPEAEMFLGKTDFKLNSMKGEGYVYQCVLGACAENSN